MFPTDESVTSEINQSHNSKKEIGCSYKVQDRDTLCKIAVNYDTTMSYLMKMNKLSSTIIFPGQILQVPKKAEQIVSNNLIHEEDEIEIPFASNIEDAYTFLSPLCVSTTGNSSSTLSTIKPFKDLAVVSSSSFEKNPKIDEKIEKVTGISQTSVIPHQLNTFQYTDSKPFSTSATAEYEFATRERLFSIESLTSEPFEENFLKINVHFVTGDQEPVHGILLVTATSVMFDPDPLCPLVKEQGCEKFGLMFDMNNVVSVTMYKEAAASNEIQLEMPSLTLKESEYNLSDSFVTINDASTCSETDAVGIPKVLSSKHPKNNETEVDKISNDISQSIGFSEEDGQTLSSSCLDESDKFYICIRSTQPMMKTFSVINSLSDCADMDERKNNANEAWFHIAKRNSDQMMAFFMQWSPDPYVIDFAEQNGFIMADSLDSRQNKKRNKAGKRSRSSTGTCSSSEYSVDFPGSKNKEKEWELISIKEAKRRTELNANELANDDTSLIPELKQSSNLIKDDILLELCKRMPARCIGCPWRLLYSTFEHGMSLRTLYRKMEQQNPEESPVFIIVQDTEGYIFGAFSSSSPHISEHFYGSGESFLFKLEPELEFFDWSGENNFFMKGSSDDLVLGGGDGSAGLWMDGDLRHGRSRSCLTFNNCVLSSKEDFFIQDVEVWGFEDN